MGKKPFACLVYVDQLAGKHTGAELLKQSHTQTNSPALGT